jgi:hypothetical protein
MRGELNNFAIDRTQVDVAIPSNDWARSRLCFGILPNQSPMGIDCMEAWRSIPTKGWVQAILHSLCWNVNHPSFANG